LKGGPRIPRRTCHSPQPHQSPSQRYAQIRSLIEPHLPQVSEAQPHFVSRDGYLCEAVSTPSECVSTRSRVWPTGSRRSWPCGCAPTRIVLCAWPSYAPRCCAHMYMSTYIQDLGLGLTCAVITVCIRHVHALANGPGALLPRSLLVLGRVRWAQFQPVRTVDASG